MFSQDGLTATKAIRQSGYDHLILGLTGLKSEESPIAIEVNTVSFPNLTHIDFHYC